MPVTKTLSLLLWSLLLLLLGGCSDEHVEPLPPLPADARILAFGDSLTYGSGVDAEHSYPAVLQGLTGREVINAGVPGERSGQGLERLPALLREYQPHLLLLCHGGNDMLRRQSMAQMEANLEAMIRLAREQGIPVVLLGVPRPAIFGLESAEQYYNVASRTGSPLEDHIIPKVLSDNALKSDQIHPNATGYRLMAEAVFTLLQKAGALQE